LKDENKTTIDFLPDIHNDANRPHIQRSVITFVLQHFWSCTSESSDQKYKI